MVKLNCLDFLNNSPNFFIFQNETNKTNFGGVLFLIYIIVMVFISLAYILDYSLNVKYEIQASTITYRDKSFDITPNPEVDMLIGITLYEDINITNLLYVKIEDQFYSGVYNKINEECENFCRKGRIEYHIKAKYLELEEKRIDIVYRCEDDDCEDLYDPNNNLTKIDSIIIQTKSYIIDHYGDIPLKISNDYDCINSFSYIYDETYDTNFDALIHWISIVYKEKQGISRIFNNLLGISDNITWGYVEFDYAKDLFRYDGYSYDIDYDTVEDTKHMMAVLGTIRFEQTKYIQYIRKKIEFTDVIATIGALFSTFNFIFSTICKYYSKNFDNYKIVEKLLDYHNINKTKKIMSNIIKNKEIELNNMNEIKKPEIDDIDEKDKEINNDIIDPLIKDISIEKEKEEINDIDINIFDKKMLNKEKKIYLPKLTFFDFFLENIYCKKCKKSKKQELINICNQIIAEYASIDSVLIKMITLENLFKDYKWINPKLNDLSNNRLIQILLDKLNI